MWRTAKFIWKRTATTTWPALSSRTRIRTNPIQIPVGAASPPRPGSFIAAGTPLPQGENRRMKTRVRATVLGRVQGVGFRPTVYRYAMQFGLCGFVCNGPQGVTIEVEGEDLKIGAFFQQLTNVPPKQAVIAEVQKEVCAEKGYQRFEVVESEPSGDMAVHIPPDLATCDDCLREISDPRNRRQGYAFTNCTNCGPRFTIIRDLPYDRDKTSMAKFTMCERCDSEYHDPQDRRFHAQPNACSRLWSPLAGARSRRPDERG